MNVLNATEEYTLKMANWILCKFHLNKKPKEKKKKADLDLGQGENVRMERNKEEKSLGRLGPFSGGNKREQEGGNPEGSS